MIFQYNFELTEFPNGKCDLTKLANEIRNSTIKKALDYITQSLGYISAGFKEELDSTDSSILNNIISSHDGESDNEPETTFVKIKEETHGETQGHFQSRTMHLYTDGSALVQNCDISFPYPISLFSAEWLVAEDHVGDSAEFHLGPDTIIGYLTQTLNSGDSSIYVSDTVMENIKLGFYIGIEDSSLFGRVISKDTENKCIEIEYPKAEIFNAGSLVKMTVKIVPEWKFIAPGFCSVGESKIGASFIPSNTILRMVYHNENGLTHKKLFGISIDYLY
jgi:hypothetical protein